MCVLFLLVRVSSQSIRRRNVPWRRRRKARVSLHSGSNIARSSDKLKVVRMRRTIRPSVAVPQGSLTYGSSAAAEKCLFCFDESLVLFLSSRTPRNLLECILHPMLARCDTIRFQGARGPEIDGRFWTRAICFARGFRNLLVVCYAEICTAIKSGRELLAKSAEDWFPYWNFRFDTARRLVFVKTSNLINL